MKGEIFSDERKKRKGRPLRILEHPSMAACLTQTDTSKSCMELYLTEIKLTILSYFSCIPSDSSLLFIGNSSSWILKILKVLKQYTHYFKWYLLTVWRYYAHYISKEPFSLPEEQDGLKITCVVIRKAFV